MKRLIKTVINLKTILNKLLERLRIEHTGTSEPGFRSSSFETTDVAKDGFPLVPDDYHLRHVGKTVQGNGYWITSQIAIEDDEAREFVAAYVFDKKGDLISCEVIDCGIRSQSEMQPTDEIVERLKQKIDAKETNEILVKPFSRSFYGHIFGLILREKEEGEDDDAEILIDAMPGYTLMFYGPWSHCNYDS